MLAPIGQNDQKQTNCEVQGEIPKDVDIPLGYETDG